MPLTADPAAVAVAAAGAVASVKLANAGAAKIAFKVMSSNNREYRIKPVFGFVDAGAGAPVEITRLVSIYLR